MGQYDKDSDCFYYSGDIEFFMEQKQIFENINPEDLAEKYGIPYNKEHQCFVSGF